jgi:Xaa-Pro dipeptidase
MHNSIASKEILKMITMLLLTNTQMGTSFRILNFSIGSSYNKTYPLGSTSVGQVPGDEIFTTDSIEYLPYKQTNHQKMEIKMSTQKNGTPFEKRQAQLLNLMQNAGLEAVVLNPGHTMVYLTGLHFHLSERPVVVFFVPGVQPVVVYPELETAKIKALPYPVQAFPYGEDPVTWEEVFKAGADAAGINNLKVGVEPRALRVLELRLLESSAPKANFISAEESLAYLRMRKDPNEIDAMREAVMIAQRAIMETLEFIQQGKTERQIATELTLQVLKAGSDASIPFAPIVASGPNSANPHAVPSDRRLQKGDLLIIDWGACYEGYISDLTRTFAIGQVELEFERIAQIVASANEAGRSAARQGITAGEVDLITRTVIAEAGYGQYFTHRTGHGIGMEGHEAPYIYKESQLPLAAGMTFTIEPGIYLPDRGGVRIEDNVVITDEGAESLSDLPRELITIE